MKRDYIHLNLFLISVFFAIIAFINSDLISTNPGSITSNTMDGINIVTVILFLLSTILILVTFPKGKRVTNVLHFLMKHLCKKSKVNNDDSYQAVERLERMSSFVIYQVFMILILFSAILFVVTYINLP